MLELRPSCECCGTSLPPSSSEAMICSFECTFCLKCTKDILKERCPNCNGDLVHRPTRSEDLLTKYPASTKQVVRSSPCVT